MAYRYGWDSVNRKKRYMGKYPEVNPQGQGYYGNNEAGNPQEFTKKTGVHNENLSAHELKNIHFRILSTELIHLQPHVMRMLCVWQNLWDIQEVIISQDVEEKRGK